MGMPNPTTAYEAADDPRAEPIAAGIRPSLDDLESTLDRLDLIVGMLVDRLDRVCAPLPPEAPVEAENVAQARDASPLRLTVDVATGRVHAAAESLELLNSRLDLG